MTQYNILNVKLSNSQLNMVGNSNDNTNFPQELLLTNRQVANITHRLTLNYQKLNYQK